MFTVSMLWDTIHIPVETDKWLSFPVDTRLLELEKLTHLFLHLEEQKNLHDNGVPAHLLLGVLMQDLRVGRGWPSGTVLWDLTAKAVNEMDAVHKARYIREVIALWRSSEVIMTAVKLKQDFNPDILSYMIHIHNHTMTLLDSVWFDSQRYLEDVEVL